MKKTVNIITCDKCGKESEPTVELPKYWAEISVFLSRSNNMLLLDLCPMCTGEDGSNPLVFIKYNHNE